MYKAYDRIISKSKGQIKIDLKTTNVVEVRGVSIPCCEIDINDLLGWTYRIQHDLDDMVEKETLYDLKAWLALMIGSVAPSWLGEGAAIEKKELNILVQF